MENGENGYKENGLSHASMTNGTTDGVHIEKPHRHHRTKLGRYMEASGIDSHDPYDVVFGRYNYASLCMPTWPYCIEAQKRMGIIKERPVPPFYAVDQMLSLFLAALMGLQHALAMIGGLITPPLLIGELAPTDQQGYYQTHLVASALIVSGIATIVHVISIKIPFTSWWAGGQGLQYGTGIISVAGISFTFLTTAQNSIKYMMEDGDSFDTQPEVLPRLRRFVAQAYGRFIGTLLPCTWLVVAMSFLPARVVRRVFPPFIPGVTIFLIGAALIGTSGFVAWGGGAYCEEYANGLPSDPISCLVPYNDTTAQGSASIDHGSGVVSTGSAEVLATGSSGTQWQNGTCYGASVIPLCNGNGSVELYFGAPEYIGLGFLVFATLVFIEIFGSPFMRNAEVIIALLFGYLMAGVITREGQHYVSTANITSSPGITFLWVKTYPFGFYAPAVLPCLVAFLVTAVEAIGDITATEEASRIATQGTLHNARVQGGLLGDGFNCFVGALAFTLPTTTFAQNNGVIVLTRCGSRSAGVACGAWLVLFGVIAKIGAFFTSIPQCVLGGMTTFLFASVTVSGIKVITLTPLTRRNRFILAISLGLGLGVTIVPEWATNHLWPVVPSMDNALRSFRDSCILLLSNGFAVGCLASIILHLIIPMEDDAPVPELTRPEGLYDKTLPGGESGMRPRSSVDPVKPMNYPDPKMDMDREDTAHGAAHV